MSAPPIAIYPAPRTPPQPRSATPRRILAGGARTVAGLAIVLLVTAAGIGWLYTLRRAGTLVAGPRIADALPLQRLAGGAAQPAARLVAAWLPAGLVAGVALRTIGFDRRAPRAVCVFVCVLALLLLAGAVADAITANEPLAHYAGRQPYRVATWLAAMLAAVGTALPRSTRR